MHQSATQRERERVDQRVYASFTASELDQIDEWGFSRRIRERSQVIRRLTLSGLEAESEKSEAARQASGGDGLATCPPAADA